MADDSELLTYEVNGQAVLDFFAELDDLLGTITANLDTLQTSFDDLANVDEVIASVSESFDVLDTSIADATANIGEFTAAVDENAAALADETASADEASVSQDALGESAQGAQAGLLLIVGAAAMVGKSFLDMGIKAQDGFALVQGMAGDTSLPQYMGALEQQASDLGVTLDQEAAALYEVDSAGYSLANGGLNVLKYAQEAAKAGAAQTQVVASALTSELHAYNLSAKDAGKVTDEMIETVVLGKQQFSDLAGAIGPLAAVGHNVGISLEEVNAAEATMTQINPNVRMDVNELKFLFNAMSLSVQGVATNAKKLKLNFDETRYTNDNLIQRLQYLAEIAGGTNTEAFKKLTGGAAGMQAALILLSGSSKTYESNLQQLQHAQGATDRAFGVSEETISSHVDHIKSALSIMATNVVTAITPAINGALKLIGEAFDWLGKHQEVLMPLLASLAGMLGVILVAAIGALLAPLATLITTMGPIILAIGAIAAGAVILAQHWKQVTGAFSDNGPLSGVTQVLQVIAGVFVSILTPIIQQFKDLWTQQLLPLFRQLWAAIQPLLPLLKLLAIVIGGELVIALGLFVGLIVGVIKALAGFLAGIATVIGGIVQVFTGIVQVISGIVQFIVDLVTGHFNKLGADLGKILGGFGNIFGGAWNIIKGIFQAALGAISGLVSGFVQGIGGFFGGLVGRLISSAEEMRDKVGIAHAQMAAKIDAITVMSGMKLMSRLEDQRIALLAQLQKTHDPIKRRWLEHELTINAIETKAQEARIQLAEKDKKKQIAKLKELHDKLLEDQKNFAQRFLEKIGEMFSGLGTFVHDKLTAIGQFFTDKWDGLIAFVKSIPGKILQALEGLGETLLAPFKWFYDHNIYVKAAVDDIHQKLTDLKNFVGAIFNWLGTHIREKLTDVKNFIGGVFSWIGTQVHQKLTDAKNFVGGIFDALGTTVHQKLTDLKNVVGGIFSDIGTAMHQKMIDAWNLVTSFVSGWPSQAFQWGVNLIKNLISGIGSMFSKLGSTVHDIAGNIAKFLGFHSPTEEGPGSTADQWAPNLIKMYAKGIEEGIPLVELSAQKLMKPLAITMQGSIMGGNAHGNMDTSLMSRLVAAIERLATGNGSQQGTSMQFGDVHLNGIQDIRALAQELQSYNGQGVENALFRGAGVGW